MKCADEQELLLKFLDHWKLNYPDVITGWNSRMFDIVYLINRVTKIFSEGVAKQFSPWNLIRSETIEIAGKPHQFYTISGIQQLDYIDLFKKFGYAYGTQESYKLDNIANVVLGDDVVVVDALDVFVHVIEDEDIEENGVAVPVMASASGVRIATSVVANEMVAVVVVVVVVAAAPLGHCPHSPRTRISSRYLITQSSSESTTRRLSRSNVSKKGRKS